MKILHKYILKEHLGPLTFALAALTSLLLLNAIAKQFGMLAGKGLPWRVIGEFFALSLPYTLALSLPMAVLIATMYAFSRLAADNEITALKSTGVGMMGLLIPVLIASVGVTLFMLFFNDQILPRSNHQLAILTSDIGRTNPTFALREQVINEVSPGKFYMRANHIDAGSNRMREVTIYDMSDATRRRTIYADSGTLAMAWNHTDLLMVLYDGSMQDVPTNNLSELQRLFFRTDQIQMKGVTNQFQKSAGNSAGNEEKGNREMSVCEMQRVVDRTQADYTRAEETFETTVARARMLHLRLDPATLRFTPRGQSRVTLGGEYCSLLRRLGVPGLGIRTPPAGGTTGIGLGRPAMQTVPLPSPASAQQVAAQQQAAMQHFLQTAQQQAQQQAQQRERGRQAAEHLVPRAPTPLRQLPVSPPIRLPGQGTRGTTAPPARFPPATAQLPHPIPRIPLPTHPGVPPLTPAPPAIGRIIARPFPPSPIAVPSTEPMALSVSRMRMNETQSTIDSYEVEIHKKFALAVACSVFVLLGAPIALRFPRAGVGLVIGVSLFVFALYYVGLIAGGALGSRGIISPWLAMWLPDAIFCGIGVALASRMNKTAGAVRSSGTWETLDRMRQWLARALHHAGVLRERQAAA